MIFLNEAVENTYIFLHLNHHVKVNIKVNVYGSRQSASIMEKLKGFKSELFN